MDVFDGSSVFSKTYSYQGYLTQDPPEQRMICGMTLVWNGVEPFPSESYVTSWRSVSSYPIGYSYATSNPVAFTKVTETRSDDSRTEYEYYKGTLVDEAVSRPSPHPSTWSPSITDPGRRQPRLKRRSVYDSSGTEVYRESLEYASPVDGNLFSTGVRLYSNVTWSDYRFQNRFFTENEKVNIDQWINVGGASLPSEVDDFLFFKKTEAARIPTLPSRRTEMDLTTNVTTVTEYKYDDNCRTLQPRFQTVTNSDGSIHKIEYTYPFNHDDSACSEMTQLELYDLPVETRLYSGDKVISSKRTDYLESNGFFYPVKLLSWSLPTGTAPGVPAALTEREKVGSYNATGSLTTSYSYKPLFGLLSVTLPNGYKTNYSYNAAGKLASVADTDGAIETYSYSLRNHSKAIMTGAENSVTTTRFLNVIGPRTVVSRQYFDNLGRPSSVAEGGMNSSGKYVYTALSYDSLGREAHAVLPSVGSTSISNCSFTQVKALSNSTYEDQYAWSETTYDALDRRVRVTTPGDAWHTARKAKATEYISNAKNSVRLYTAPMNSTSLSTANYYDEKTLHGVRSIDEDGKEMTVYTDKLGRKVLERRGPESKKGQNDTYFVYNDLGQLRFVLSPSYQESANLTEFAYEYRYDQHGNVVYKAIPGASYTQYWYDRAGRLAYMQDANLRASGLFRFFLYDTAGRQVIQGVCKTCTRDETVNFAAYTGATSGFMSTGYTLANASRIQQATIETVAFFDAYTFNTNLDTHLKVTGTASAKGLQTGGVVYASDGSKSVSAIYYDKKGRVTETRELTNFGSKRTTTTSYNYAGQPLKTTFTEGDVNIITENTYDSSSGLLTATDVTVNGTKQCISKVTYDDLGRIKSEKRGNDSNSGGTVSYSYNIHGQTKNILGPGFIQNLYYADGSGTKLYNGSISSMTWKMGTDVTIRGYRYFYNEYGWLSGAIYAEGKALTANRDKYSEKITGFTRNGGITGLQRYGKQAAIYGKIDDLTITYSGIRISTVKDAAPGVTQNGSMDFPGGTTSAIFSYNAFGALSADPSRGITSISYDNFGNPIGTVFSGSRSLRNVYSATGEKLKTTVHSNATLQADAALSFGMDMDMLSADDTAAANGVAVLSTTEYHGPVIYKDGAIDMVLFPGGYATIRGASVTFHYYTKDYLGNNRAVINGSTGAIEQTIAYYPYGAVIADLGTPTTVQPYKFGGKELLTANGLNEYDFGARNYYPAVPGFTKPDQMCEKYYWLSPYLYCANNPVNLIDPSGKIIEMPKESTVGQTIDVLLNLQKIIDDKLTFSTQEDGSIRISIKSRGKGLKITGTDLVRRLTSSSKTLTINVIDHGGNYQSSENPADASNGIGTNTGVYFNPDSNPDIMEVNPKTHKSYFTKRPSFMGLTHELIHAERSMRGASFDNKETEFHAFTNPDGEPDVEEIPKEEAATIGFNHVKWFGLSENRIRKEMGLNPRGAYYSRRRR